MQEIRESTAVGEHTIWRGRCVQDQLQLHVTQFAICSPSMNIVSSKPVKTSLKVSKLLNFTLGIWLFLSCAHPKIKCLSD